MKKESDKLTEESFHTFSEYMKKEDNNLTASMEDYVEMIFRLTRDIGFTRILELSKALNVQPPSTTKMVQRLSEIGIVKYEKYGIIILTDKGRSIGAALLERHNVVEGFLKLLGLEEGILEETEKIEHTISSSTVECMADFIKFIQEKTEFISEFERFRENLKKS